MAFLGKIQWFFQHNSFQACWCLKFASHHVKIHLSYCRLHCKICRRTKIPYLYIIYERPKWLGPRFLRKWLNIFQISFAQKQIMNCLQDLMFLDFAFSPRGACPSPSKFWPPGGVPVQKPPLLAMNATLRLQ